MHQQIMIAQKIASGPPPGGFPQIASTTPTYDPSNQTSHALSMPATVSAGNLLVAMMSFGDNSNPTITTPSGWSSLAQANDPGFTRKSAVFYKVAAGTEGGTTVDFVTSINVGVNALVARITGAAASGMIEQATQAISGTLSAAPADLTPSWGVAETLWMVFAVGFRGNTVNSYPFASDQYSQVNNGGVGTILFCSAEDEIATIDPANVVFNNSEGWGNDYGNIYTIGIKPV